MLGPYNFDSKNTITYLGNNVCDPLTSVADVPFTGTSSQQLLYKLTNDSHHKHLHNIDNAIFNATVAYFAKIAASWCNLPLTTRMISSPGELYRGKKLDYTSDALPVDLQWFDAGSIFLSESSQFYLELRLLIDGVDKVFSIYNSFRKEKADFSHLTEFQHIEFEGKVDFEENIEIFIGLLEHVTKHILKYNREDLEYYLPPEDIQALATAFDAENIETIRFSDAMDILYKTLGDEKYKQQSLKHFGSFEEVVLTRTVGKHCLVTEFPLEEIPFYHDESFQSADGKKYARNADLILLGYREVVGSGRRITSIDAIREKAKFFNLPAEDYEPYINMRELESYKTTAGFGVGWQRYTQWLLKMPFIWDMSHIPRGHLAPKP